MILNDDYQTGTWLRRIRLNDGLTQEEMAKRIGTNRGTYSSWESRYKTRRIPQKILFKIYGYFLIPAAKIEIKEEESIWKRILKWIMHKN